MRAQAQRYKDAVTAFTAAQQLNPNDPTVPTLLQQAQNSLNNLQTALSQFQTALASGNLPGATTAYNTAAGLAPNDPAVVKAGSDLKNAQSNATSNANFQAQVTAGKNALQAQRYKDAVTAFTAAQQLNPNDPTVPQLLKQAQNSLNNLQTALSQFQTALASGNLPGATTAYNTAAGLAPNDPAVVKAGSDLKNAQSNATSNANFQAQVTAGKNARAGPALQRRRDSIHRCATVESERSDGPTAPQAGQNSLTNLQTALSQFQTALASGNLTSAATAYNTAAGLAPNDPAVVKAGSDLKNAQSNATSNANFQAQVTAGKDAMQAQRYKDAVTAFTAAQQLNPNDLMVPTLLKQAQTALTNLQTALSQFQAALAAGNLTSAATAYNTAAGLAPNDPAVVKAGSDLQKAQSNATTQRQFPGPGNSRQKCDAGPALQRRRDSLHCCATVESERSNGPPAPQASAEFT